MHQHTSHRDPSMDSDYRPTKYGSTDSDRLQESDSSIEETKHSKQHLKHSYRNLVLMGILHIPIMYLIMFSMVDTWNDVYQNLNTFYMALMMAAPMVAVMPFMMKEMYPDKKKNGFIVLGSLVVLLGAFAAIRYQSAIRDSQFIRSMIPHHSGAILMCDKAKLTDPDLKTLCDQISQGQRKEIQQMEEILKRL